MAPKDTHRVSAKAARIVGRGKGTWYRATTRRIKPGDVGLELDGTDVKGNCDVKLSAAFDQAFAAVVSAHEAPEEAQVALVAAARIFATNRGSKRVWDIDLAAAIGYPWTPEGASEFRAAYGLAARSVAAAWPARVSETPFEDTPRGPVLDPATGRVRS
jgi:hypothetical protein